ncbi:alpha/beta hydrolase [Glaciihabitans arcticus]|uniref:alpha/beta hydrolase n=1 Tax=Glaciihabitans arcticus TaxID=2668039 RepID=UPI00195EE6C9|nr:alpha/beta hydrolase [Glaciihabitans arcticus]
MDIALIASPLLGSASWEPVAALLPGAQVVSAETPPATGIAYAQQVLDALPDDRQWVLVAHSNAGAVIPYVASRRSVAALVFVDAILPPPVGEQPLAAPGFMPFLASLASSGELPVWTSWWDSVASLFPSAAVQSAVSDQQLRLPLSYFQSTMDVPAGWDAVPCFYVAFGDTYASERADASARGWDVTILDGAHLHQLVDPAAVASVIRRACG